jgi:hypothetical protein
VKKLSWYSRACADQRALMTVVTVIAALAIRVQLRLAAQDQPQQKQELPASTAATGNYNFLIGSGFLCDPPGSDVCPAVAKADSGETIEITGAGTLGLANKSVTAAGAFTEKSPNGYIVTTGVWTATQLVSFDSYGLDPGALLRDYPQFRRLGLFVMAGPKMPGPMTGPMAGLMAGPTAAGGMAVIRIRLLADAGSPGDGLLRVNCAKGKMPEDEQSDGVRLDITVGQVFSEQVSGRAIFLLQRPGPTLAGSSRRAARNSDEEQ